jgi:hypothetical protein
MAILLPRISRFDSRSDSPPSKNPRGGGYGVWGFFDLMADDEAAAAVPPPVNMGWLLGHVSCDQ